MMSVVLFPKADHPHLSALTLEAGAAVVEALPDRFEARLKWPNDIMVRGRKLGGILCERDDLPDGRLAIIVGIGVNVEVPEAAFPPELRGIATSLSIEDQDPFRNYGIGLMIDHIRKVLVARFTRFEAEGLDVATAERLSATLGGRVRDEAGREGHAVGIAPSGALRVRWDGSESESEVVAGDIVPVPA
jgi:BirA family biotin operon repressor/biotin-[acetyl-CoA-carboxylase] ligase